MHVDLCAHIHVSTYIIDTCSMHTISWPWHVQRYCSATQNQQVLYSMFHANWCIFMQTDAWNVKLFSSVLFRQHNLWVNCMNQSALSSLEGVQIVDDCYFSLRCTCRFWGHMVCASCIVTDVHVLCIDLRWPFFDRNFWASPVPLADYSPFWQQRTLRVCTMSAMCESMWQRVGHSRT